jgi:hypothetical protein
MLDIPLLCLKCQQNLAFTVESTVPANPLRQDLSLLVDPISGDAQGLTGVVPVIQHRLQQVVTGAGFKFLDLRGR